MEEETREAGTTGTRTVVDTEVVAGEETKDGEGTITTGGTETEKETGTGDMEVGINQAPQIPTRDITPTIRGHMSTAELYSHLPSVVSIHSIYGHILCTAVLYVVM